ncbi:hypothetical protein [Microvirga massiliensis]|uniref:hypothetical protein n=1 Tax=Microvirga massiliensis TaxID=1033741 RepID=UPI00062B72EF|nr:hypothetical protein [Microvirga massiliensis]
MTQMVFNISTALRRSAAIVAFSPAFLDLQQGLALALAVAPREGFFYVRTDRSAHEFSEALAA